MSQRISYRINAWIEEGKPRLQVLARMLHQARVFRRRPMCVERRAGAKGIASQWLE